MSPILNTQVTALSRVTLSGAALAFAALLSGCVTPRDIPHTPIVNSVNANGVSNAFANAIVMQAADLQARLDTLGQGKAALAAKGQGSDSAATTTNQYLWAKAQCWVRHAYSEYQENDASGFTSKALDEASKITKGLESQNASYLDTPLINHSQAVRPDLWQQAAKLKQHKGYACAAATVGCLEVQLSRAGHELADTGWRHANSYLAIAEDMAAKAKQQADTCQPSVTPPPPTPPLPAAPPPPKPTIVPVPLEAIPAKPVARTVETVVLNASALFYFDKRTEADLLPQGKEQIEQLARRINQVYESVESITLVGYTDRLGSDAYNQTLSEDRAQTVKAYLHSKGLSAPMHASGLGKANPVVTCSGHTPTPALTACLQPNRRVEITISGVKR